MTRRKIRDKTDVFIRHDPDERHEVMWLECVGDDFRVTDRDFRNLAAWALSAFDYDTRVKTLDLKPLPDLQFHQGHGRDPIAHVVRRLIRLNWLTWHTSHGRTRLVASRPPLHETHPWEFNRGH